MTNNLSRDQFTIATKVDRIGDSRHLVTVEQRAGDKRVAARSYTVSKTDVPNPSARGGAVKPAWQLRGTGTKAFHDTLKAATAAAEHHFTNVYLGGR